ncbi:MULTISPECIES: hypothetical protein [unclassified Kitasatospora]|uniref:hypothetical protein n=1 Tax=unclassified Kitasatospora TaxID=2633591 RepID=UPI0033EB962A
MRILVLGGTSFVDRTIVDDALRSGAEVTLFNRGRTNPGLFPDARRLIGDRDTGDLTALREGHWDAVVDVSGYRPHQVDQAMAVLGDRVGRYLYISSHAVYRRDGLAPGSDESAPLRAPLREAEQLTEETYGRPGRLRGRRHRPLRRTAARPRFHPRAGGPGPRRGGHPISRGPAPS